jgi:hypothetical protein
VLEALEDRTLLSCNLSLTPSEASPQLVGDPIVWTATPGSDCPPNLVYQFNVAPAGLPAQIVRDFSPTNSFQWAPMQEGSYDITVIAKAGYRARDTISATVSDEVASRVTGSSPVITPTANPLVALYSAPPHPGGGSMHVEFAVDSPNPIWKSTAEEPYLPGLSTNFLVAGMLPNTTYLMRSVLSNGRHSRSLTFTTGNLPTALHFPTFNVLQSPGPGSDLEDNMVYHMLIPRQAVVANPTATDLQGRVEWYYDARNSGLITIAPVSVVPGGTALLFASDSYSPDFINFYNVVREIDLAGNPLRETSTAAVNAQLLAMGHEITYGFHHEAKRLPNGDTAVLALTHKTVVINSQPENYLGDDIIVLDQNFQVVWVWDAFDHLDVNRGPILGETDMNGNVDWLHSNSISWSPADGNLSLSLRNQDWVIKIDYENGNGDGHVIWRLGLDGDFTVVGSSDPYPWFSHQHDVNYVDDNTLVVFDNGNTRIAGDRTGNSRGQAWQIDEQTLTATPLLNADLGVKSLDVGAAQQLSNGNFSFDAGLLISGGGKLSSQTIEVLPAATISYDLQQNETGEYRSYRMGTLYEGANGSQDTGPGTPSSATSGQARVTDPVPLTGLATPALSMPELAEGSLLAPLAGAALLPNTGGELVGSPLAAPLAASRSRGGGAVPEGLFADLGRDWLIDPLQSLE